MGGTGALAGLLAAEVLAAPAVVNEALSFIWPGCAFRDVVATIALQAALTVILMQRHAGSNCPDLYVAIMPAIALAVALGCGSLAKAWLLGSLLQTPIGLWRTRLVIAALAALIAGVAFLRCCPSFRMGGAGDRHSC